MRWSGVQVTISPLSNLLATSAASGRIRRDALYAELATLARAEALLAELRQRVGHAG
jgi:hypothetical protein